MNEIITIIENYITSLDWTYILTFIIICLGINQNSVKAGIKKVIRIQALTRYRVLIIGALYGSVIYFIRGYKLSQIENLFQSLIFALVFHKLILEGIFFWLARVGLPKQITRHFIPEEKLKKLYGE